MEEEQKGIENTLRKVLNSIRSHEDSGKAVKNVENYIFGAFTKHFVNLGNNKLNKKMLMY
ncbi:hypothetical protein [Lactobacillus gasseri]|uniref:hypothetical protein n=1 Tax=Lactobacillus gasseri TaxID=1596 RepID=UPI0023AA1B63|nr:hypothetical protein [Lactobacillus gasseri]